MGGYYADKLASLPLCKAQLDVHPIHLIPPAREPHHLEVVWRLRQFHCHMQRGGGCRAWRVDPRFHDLLASTIGVLRHGPTFPGARTDLGTPPARSRGRPRSEPRGPASPTAIVAWGIGRSHWTSHPNIDPTAAARAWCDLISHASGRAAWAASSIGRLPICHGAAGTRQSYEGARGGV